MDIIKAIRDVNLFGPFVDPNGDLTSWKNWLTFFRVLYGHRTRKTEYDLIRTCTGRDPAKISKDGYSEALLLCGRRSGKSKMIALCGAAEAILSGKEKNLSPGEIPMVAILSPTRFQSRIIRNYLKAVFDSSPILQQEVVDEKREGFKLRNGVEVSIITGDPRTCRGFSVIAAIVDEIAFFGLSEESRVRSDTELIRALRPSLASTNGRLLAVGTPYASRGYAYTTWKRHFGNADGKVLVWNAPSLVMNPTLNPSVVENAVEEDPVAASVEFCIRTGLFREDVSAFIARQTVEALVIRGREELPPRGGVKYAAFADMSGGRHDDASLAIAHKEGPLIVLDVLERYPPPHDPHQVVASMCHTLGRYGCDRCLGDNYSAEWVKSTFQQHGIRYERASTSVWNEGTRAKNKIGKSKSVLYSELLPRITAGELELLDNDMLVTQLTLLERRTRSGGRDSIDHPPGGHDDLANCLAGVVDAVAQRKVAAGVVQPDSSKLSPVTTSRLSHFLRRPDHENLSEEAAGFHEAMGRYLRTGRHGTHNY